MAILNISGDEDPESYGEISFQPDDGLSEEGQQLLDDGLRLKNIEDFNQYYGTKQLQLKRLEKEDIEEYKYINQQFKNHKNSLKKETRK